MDERHQPGASSRCPSGCACSASPIRRFSGQISASACSCSSPERSSSPRSRSRRTDRDRDRRRGREYDARPRRRDRLAGPRPAMVLMRAPLGLRGSYLATALNVLQNLGWAVFELIVIAAAAAALSDSVFGFEAKWLWTILFGMLAAVLALAGRSRSSAAGCGSSRSGSCSRRSSISPGGRSTTPTSARSGTRRGRASLSGSAST